MNTKHTPTPWTFSEFGPISTATGNIHYVANIAKHGPSDTLDQEDKANAEFIVRACNCHDELVAFANRVATSYSVGGCSAQSLERGLEELRWAARAILAKAKATA